ncbi:MAG: SCO family protein [Tumebacillaceae bacterium]
MEFFKRSLMKRNQFMIQFVLLLTTALLFTACGGTQGGQSNQSTGENQSSDNLAVQDTIQDFTLTNVNKQQVSLQKDIPGKAKLVYFFYASCGDVCPVTQKRMEKIMGDLKKQNVSTNDFHFVSISFDPKRDTPDVLKTYSQIYKATPDSWQFLTGKKEQIDAIMKQFHVEATETSTHDFLHDDRIFLVDSKNQVRASYPMAADVKDSDIINDMKQLIAQS